MYCQTALHRCAPSSRLFTCELRVTQLGASTSPTPRVLTVVVLLASELKLPSA